MALDGRATDKRRIQDSDGDIAEISSEGFTYADEAVHLRINKDKEYFVCYEWSTVTAASTVTFSIMTNTKYTHGSFKIVAEAGLSFKLELSTLTTQPAGATEVFPHNLNRGMNNCDAIATFWRDSTASDSSKVLECGRAGSAIPFASSDQGAYWLLDTGRVYHIRITNTDVASKYILIKYRWHEHGVTEGTGNGEDENEYNYVPV